MKKGIIIIIGIILIIVLGFLLFGKDKNEIPKQSQSNYQAEKSIIENKTQNTNITKINKERKDINGNTINNDTEENSNKSQEVEIASFTTKIYNKDSERQNNISITCNSLTNKEVKSGEVFSFCNTVGKATTSKGYQEADIYVDGKKEQGLGGGNCQVSTTLYNAVVKIPELEIIERHEHSGNVPYIQKGKDAAVAYGSYDFKFKNNTQNTIKIKMEKTENEITAKLIKII